MNTLFLGDCDAIWNAYLGYPPQYVIDWLTKQEDQPIIENDCGTILFYQDFTETMN